MSKIWTPAERAITALTLGTPDEVPTFELEFQLSEEFFGYPLDDPRLHGEERAKLSASELEKAAYDLADKSRIQRLLERAEVRRVSEDVSHGDHDAGRPLPLQEVVALPLRLRHRLLQ